MFLIFMEQYETKKNYDMFVCICPTIWKQYFNEK